MGRDVLEEDRLDIEAALHGDEVAYARLVERYEAAISAQMWRFTRDRVTLEELVQDVFVEVYFGLGRFRGEAPFLHWIRRIASRVGYRYWKREYRRRAERDAIEQNASNRSQHVAASTPGEAGEILFGLLEHLAPKDRLVLTMHYLEGSDSNEVARHMGWSPTLVRVRMHRALQRLRLIAQAAGLGGNDHVQSA